MSSQLQTAQSQVEELGNHCRQLEQQCLADVEAHQSVLDELRQTTEETLQQTRSSAQDIQEQVWDHTLAFVMSCFYVKLKKFCQESLFCILQ